ncbi:hypothetical protein KQN34_001279 [Salmonella enterica subsp. enterica serovar Muenchen]|nr:hypothetical protein [Salmonella enterica subsp. enterica serovar Muenchen]EHQ0640082.1 hypothetical protein [Salmonella enterica subsp. enterica serovar Muenchen]EIJ4894192.1 hypothetical protein [Salmonella enterica subsp. enterica serovar Muenchen]EJF4001010.1 hypothetical protein [Salmonella enterica subsp. enterica serovar Muenchen]ELY1302660.1 hypothetical protein [Salmonella enterica subsp. enterica serovar Muenchen]
MKERGMIFNGEMVRAILDGRKTQTRRPVKPQPELTAGSGFSWNGCVYGAGSNDRETNRNFAHVVCPHGKPGDRIWVRETWGVVSHELDEDGRIADWTPDRPATPIKEMPFGNGYYSGHAIYAADGEFTWGDDDGYEDGRSCWKPSIHMPRLASRITLEITAVRVERLQAITLGDICKEIGCGLYDFRPATYGFQVWEELWESIYGEGSWQANPWVWVIEFKRIEGGEA